MKAINITSAIMLLLVILAGCVKQSRGEFPFDPRTGEPSDGLLAPERKRVILPHMVSRRFKENCSRHGKYWIEVIQRCEPIITPDHLHLMASSN